MGVENFQQELWTICLKLLDRDRFALINPML
jgi:hypothetical protein